MQGLNAQNNTLYNLANLIGSHDAATKHYVDSSIPKPNSFGQNHTQPLLTHRNVKVLKQSRQI